VPGADSIRDEKRRLRAGFRAARRALDADRQARAADALASAAASLPALARARTVAGYVACDGELSPATLLAAARARGAVVVLPRRVRDAPLELAHGAADTCAPRAGAAGIAEPEGPAAPIEALPLPAVALVPSVALDRRGFRLGRGGGDYDRTIPLLRACGWTVVGVCHAAQLVDALPVEPHDQPVDAVLTESGVVVPAR